MCNIIKQIIVFSAFLVVCLLWGFGALSIILAIAAFFVAWIFAFGCIVMYRELIQNSKAYKWLIKFLKNNIVVIIVLSGFLLACVIVLSIDYSFNNKDWRENVFGIIYNLLGAFGALGLTYWLLRPRFEVYPTIARTLDNRIWILVTNNSWIAKLYSIKLELAYAHIASETEYQDEVTNHIQLDCDEGITSLSPRIAGSGIEKSNRFFVFHTERGFYRQWTMLKYRISATNTISNIVDIQEEYFDYGNIKWGEFKKNQFVGVKDLYTTEDQDKVNAIIKFINETCKILRPRKVKTSEVVKMLKAVSDFIKTFPDNYNTDFSCLIEISDIVDSFKNHIIKLINLYNASYALPPTKLAYRNKLIMIIEQELYTISSQMEKTLNKK